MFSYSFSTLFYGSKKPEDKAPSAGVKANPAFPIVPDHKVDEDFDFVVTNVIPSTSIVPPPPSVTIIGDLSNLTINDYYQKAGTKAQVKMNLRYPTPNSKYIGEIDYDPEKPLNKTSAHLIYLGTDAAKNNHYLKEVDHDMAYIEAFMGQLYEMSLLYGMARAYVRFAPLSDELKTSSKELKGFKTYKDTQLTQEQLDDPRFCRRFIRCLKITECMMEDDFHSGNLTLKLQLFDADCAGWKKTWKIKGARAFVDNIIRNPETAFDLTASNILAFPDNNNDKLITTDVKGPWYSPCSTNPLTTNLKLSNNPWSAEEVTLVKKLKAHPDTLTISFEEYIDWMIDLSSRYSYVAALNIPRELTVKSTGENVINLFEKANNEFHDQLWSILPTIPEFRAFIEVNKETVLKNILVRMTLRNFRLLKDKFEALKTPGKERFSSDFDAAMINPHDLVKRFNRLLNAVKDVNEKDEKKDVKESAYQLFDIEQISVDKANALITQAKQIAADMFTLECKEGTEDWTLFENFDYQLKSKAPAPTNTNVQVTNTPSRFVM